MADAKEDQKRDRVDDLMVHLARGRVALGAAAFAAPGLTVRLIGMGKGGDAGRDYMTRMFAAREIALGAGYLLSRGSSRRTWARLGLAVDSLDIVNGLRSRQGLPLWVTAGAVAVAGGCTALGAAKVAKDVVG
ncbi:hypothetical protein [Actinomadura viridis]|uniref:Uncharacterized protein n=1 Tax=Actinomadura viridis TaxID=58110 RepID=A0A931DRI8_9ACTN|nr:hypothetical protein [Actinomadura viridis]MBG6093448.1 hypothetical protein [Actinomadura viridis]